MLNRSVISASCAAFALCLCCPAASARPLRVEISHDHPLLIFQAPAPGSGAGVEAYGRVLREAWDGLPEDLRPYSVFLVDKSGPWAAMLEGLSGGGEETRIPLVLHIADGSSGGYTGIEELEGLLDAFPFIAGVHVSGLEFNIYPSLESLGTLGLPRAVRWLSGAIETSARFGTFVTVALGELHWPRILANRWCADLLATIEEYGDYVIPINRQRGAHNVARMSALMGLWLSGTVANWGVSAGPEWFEAAHFIKPGVYGVAEGEPLMPPELYRAQLLAGAMCGANTYFFSRAEDLWFGARRHAWDEAIGPLLTELLGRGYIARKDLVRRKCKVGYQLRPASSSREFHANLADIDAVYDRGALMHGGYGMERPGQVPELTPNTGRYFWVPLLPATLAETETLGFEVVVSPGDLNSPEEWGNLLRNHYGPDGLGRAFISRVGRAIFIMHTRENDFEEQDYYLEAVPAPVREIRAMRMDEGILISWPFREGDVSYSVYRRSLPGGGFTAVARDLDVRRYSDTEAPSGAALAYTVTALTNESEPLEGTVNYGDYFIVSAVESAQAEEVLLHPETEAANSYPIVRAFNERPKEPSPWHKLSEVSLEDRTAASQIAESLDLWSQAFEREDLEGVLDLYARDYKDLQGWRISYVRRAFQWFFQRYDACRMAKAVRRWDLSEAASGKVRVVLYTRCSGIAISSGQDLRADVPVHFPRGSGEVWITFSNHEGPWRILDTNPALPNFNDILSYSADESQAPGMGQDVWPPQEEEL